MPRGEGVVVDGNHDEHVTLVDDWSGTFGGHLHYEENTKVERGSCEEGGKRNDIFVMKYLTQ